MFATILFWLMMLHIAMMVIAPLLTFTDKKKRLGLRALSAWVGMFAGYGLCSWLYKLTASPEQLLDTDAANRIAIASWLTLIIGFVIVILAFIKGAQVRKTA